MLCKSFNLCFTLFFFIVMAKGQGNINSNKEMSNVIGYLKLMSNKNYAQGKDGRDGRDGRNGQDGRDGRDCKTVENKTDVKQAAETSWKECAWNNLNEGKDVGLVKNCVFAKKTAENYLKVTISSNMRVAFCKNCCKRWFVTFNGKECAPVPIDVIVFTGHEADLKRDVHRTSILTGNCKVPGVAGDVTVGLNIGKCPGYGASDGYTGYGFLQLES